MTTLVNIVVGLMGVLSLLSLLQTGLLFKIALGLGTLRERVDGLTRRINDLEDETP